MKVAVAIMVAWCASMGAASKKEPHLQMKLPRYAYFNDDIQGSCSSDNSHKICPFVAVRGNDECHLTERVKVLDKIGGCNQTDFVVKNVTATCSYHCVFRRSKVTKIVPVIEAKIVSEVYNATVFKGMPVTLNCTVMGTSRLRYHKLLWMKGNTFVQFGNEYSSRSSQFDSNTNSQTYFLTVHSSVDPAAYTCRLISTDGRVADSITQHVFIKEADSMVIKLLHYLAPFWKWHQWPAAA